MYFDAEDCTLWAKTKYGPIPIPIYSVKRRLLGSDACTHWHHGKLALYISDDVFKKPLYLDRVLFHEFTHVIESLNDPGYLSVDVEDECTRLAQTIEVGMSQLLRNLKQISKKPEKAASKTSKAKKSRQK